MKRMLSKIETPEGRIITDPAFKHVDAFNNLIEFLKADIPQYEEMITALDYHASEISVIRFSQRGFDES